MLSRRIPLFALCLTAALALSHSAPLSAYPIDMAAVDPLRPRVRGLSPKMKELISQGNRRSATFRSLVETLNQSNIVVYLENTNALPSGLDGRLTFLTSAGGVRYLHAQITNSLNVEELIAVAAHELQHAVEVAVHPEVRDAATLGLLYERIGVRTTTKDRYDTVAAQSTGKRVRAELS
jgi:hypothetical protein